MKTIVLSLLLAVLIQSTLWSQNKRALIVSIADYPNVPEKFQNWSDLSCDNDVLLVNSMLTEQKFEESNIIRLIDEQATHDGIIKAFDELLNNSSEGDIIYFHYSGHGQQIKDEDGDEEDGYDESLVAYNAPLKWYNGYDGKEHVSDDELKEFIKTLRKKLGENGQIIFVLDSCHSGTGTRGGNEVAQARGTDDPCAPEDYKPEKIMSRGMTDNDLDYSAGEGLASISTFSGCRADQVNYEYKDYESGLNYGSLTFFFTSAVKELGEKATLRNLFSKVQEGMMLELNNKQQPLIESDNIDELVFNGQLIETKPYFKLTELGNFTAKINAGSIHGLRKGDTIGFFNNDVIDFHKEDALFSGVINELKAIDSKVLLIERRDGNNAQRVQYRASLIGAVQDPVTVRIKIDIASKKVRKEVTKYFSENSFIEIVDDNYEYILRGNKDEGEKEKVQLIIAANGLPLRRMTPINMDDQGMQKVKELLFNAMRVKHFLGISLNDPNIEMELSSERDINGQYKNNESIEVMYKNNKGSKAYFKFLLIQPDKSFQFLPDDWIEIQSNDSIHDRLTFTCDNLDEPCGRYQLMLITSQTEMELGSILEMGSSLSRGSGDNEFSKYFESILTGARGFSSSNPKLDVSSYFFEINL